MALIKSPTEFQKNISLRNDKDTRFLLNICACLPDDTAPHPITVIFIFIFTAVRTSHLTNTGVMFQALTLVKTCEPVAEMRECRAPRDWSLLALQNIRTGKSHYLVICRCPPNNILGKLRDANSTLL